MPTGTSWPSEGDYLDALHRPADSLSGRLGTFVPERGPDDTLVVVSGRSAFVFFGQIEGEPTVLRCFKRPPPPEVRERYHQLRRYLRANKVSALASFRWWDEGLLVGDREVPVLTMEDVGGLSLRRHLAGLLTDPERIGELADRWQELTAELAERRLAHGDLQQDNIWVDRNGRLRLVDLDAVWAPPLAALPPAEYGHPHFQHPQRLSGQCWGEDVDRFSALVVHLSIRALAHDPGLWDEYHNDENLVLTADDFHSSMAGALWFRLASNRDPVVRDLTARLHRFCGASFAEVSPLSQLPAPDAPPPPWTLERPAPARSTLVPVPARVAIAAVVAAVILLLLAIVA
jgi:serine/threonine protein kinase